MKIVFVSESKVMMRGKPFTRAFGDRVQGTSVKKCLIACTQLCLQGKFYNTHAQKKFKKKILL